ncbi:MAG TPA: ATP-binding protein [Anaeromyxobacteraceae bacterium]|nr:ATP-binding protein [Anaeromyxobacteraceae bacterium]
MVPTTALGLLASGTGCSFAAGAHGRPSSLSARVGAFLTLALAGATLAAYATGSITGPERLFLHDAVSRAGIATAYPGRMSPQTAGALLCLGLALGLSVTRRRELRRLAQPLCLVAAALAVIAFAGHLHGVIVLFGVTRVVGVALPTAVGLLGTAVAILSLDGAGGLYALLAQRGPAGRHARHLALAALAVPFGGAVLFRWGEAAGLYDENFRAGAYIAFTALLLFGIVCALARSLLRAEVAREQLARERSAREVAETVAQQLRERVEERRRAAEALREREERLAVTLRSIGDAVIATDAIGCVTLLNGVAEALTGWRADEAIGRPLREIFRIVDEGTGEPAPCPSERVLREGVVVELANHTAIVRRDGSRWPIADSAAPIRDAAGAITGVVLVFRDQAAERRARNALEESRREALARAAQLEAVEQSLREADERKNAFLAMLSHELRNPLAPIRNSLHLLERVAAASPQSVQAKEVLGRQVDHLTRLVDDLLDITRISHGKVELRRTVVDLRDLVQKACSDHASVFEQRGIELFVSVPGSALWIDADVTRISQVLRNLLVNAVKFTPEGGKVQMVASRASERIEVAVEDDGVGLEPAALARVFEPFVQAESRQGLGRGGLGLGLALVKGLVEAHGGSVRAGSPGLDRGSAFVVTLPSSRAPEVRQDIPRAPAPASALDILVIEDNVDGAETLAAVLELHGHRTHIATDGPSGLSRARELKPSVILCDIDLPGLSGYDIARALKAEGGLPETRLIALSGYARADDRRLAIDAGFSAHLAKPVSLDELEAILSSKR